MTMPTKIIPLALAAAALLLTACYAERPPIELTDQARQLHESSLVVDGHNDLPWEVRKQGRSDFSRLNIAQRQPTLQTDLPRLAEGGVGVQFWSVWVPVSTSRRGESLLTTLEQIELVEQMARTYPNQIALASSADEIEKLRGEGKIASYIGVEGGHCIEGSLSTLRMLYNRGARYMTLTHSESLSWADSATGEKLNNGLTEFGREVIREMNRLGMMVDISHVSAETMHQTLDTTTAPVIFSHSSCREVANHPRNVPDHVLKRLPENGGVVMINFFSGFVVPEATDVYNERFALIKKLEAEFPDDEAEVDRRTDAWAAKNPMPRGTIHHVLDHIDHAVKIAGPDHVGLGSDYDGVSTLPTQLEDVTSYPLITQGLLDRGHSPEVIKKILGENAVRVFREVEHEAKRLAQAATP